MIESFEGEEWRDVPGYEGRYQISNCGRMRSLPKPCSHRIWPVKEKLLKPQWRKGRACMRYTLSRDGQSISVNAYNVMTFVFGKSPSLGLVHRPDARSENRLRGEQNGVTTITTFEAMEVKRRLAAGERQIDIARAMGITCSIVSQIKRGESWAWLP